MWVLYKDPCSAYQYSSFLPQWHQNHKCVLYFQPIKLTLKTEGLSKLGGGPPYVPGATPGRKSGGCLAYIADRCSFARPHSVELELELVLTREIQHPTLWVGVCALARA